jgi:SAM-dependent methyltransferase
MGIVADVHGDAHGLLHSTKGRHMVMRMDDYTLSMKNHLNERFRLTSGKGIYYAHKPIYGFFGGNSEPGYYSRYAVTYQIMKALAQIKFSTLLDVGGAEGYNAALAGKLFGVHVRSSDLSIEAVRRAKEIYGIDGDEIDIHNLPYPDNSFDVLLCSEVLEHVADFKKAVREIVRVCSSAAIITVPCDSKEFVESNKAKQIPHAHINVLDENSLNFLHDDGCIVLGKRYRKIRHHGAIFTVLKNGSISTPPNKNVSIKSIVNFTVPYHYGGIWS